MPKPTDPSRDLLFGLLALQTGLIDQGGLFTAFAAWTRDKGRPLADHLVELGHLDAPRRAAVEAIAGLHVQALGGDTGKSLAVLCCRTLDSRKARARRRPGRRGDPRATSARRSARPTTTMTPTAPASYSVGTATSDGQRFRIVRPHARGGLGAVFVALDGELNREVALKQILEQHADDPFSRERFIAEAEITGGLEHPGVVPVYGLGTDAGGRPYYAMRFIKGDSLKEAIAQFHEDETLRMEAGRRSLELRKLLRRFIDVCNAIDYAHSRGVIHRDIKPANIILGKHGETLVVDWGLAKSVGRADPSAGEQTHRPIVERLIRDPARQRAGHARLHEPRAGAGRSRRGWARGPTSTAWAPRFTACLTGKPPFEGEDVGAILHAVQEGRFPRPSADRPLAR